MKERINKLKQQERQEAAAQEQAVAREQSLQQPAVLEFASPEELLRYDAARTEVPGRVGQRLKQSLGDSPKPGRPWWRRLFCRDP